MPSLVSKNSKKTDNASHSGKMSLRLHFLRKYHEDNARVFDCCQGAGLVWLSVRKEFQVKSYFGVDLKAKSGRIAIDSIKVLQQGVDANVIDVDTYGEPWTHWLELLKHIKEPTTVYLTMGSVSKLAMSHVASKYVFGKTLKMPPTLFAKLWDYANQVLLTAPENFGLEIVECQEALSKSNTRYVGMHVRPETAKKE